MIDDVDAPEPEPQTQPLAQTQTDLAPPPDLQADPESTVPAEEWETEELDEDAAFHASLQRTRLTTPVTRVLLVVIVLGIGFLAGAIVQKHRQPASSSATGLPAGLSDLFGGNAPTGAGGASDNSVTGTVKLVDGANVYVEDAQGNITKVVTTDATKVTVTKPGKAADLDPATSVTVSGTKNADGSFAATEISPGSSFPALGQAAGG